MDIPMFKTLEDATTFFNRLQLQKEVGFMKDLIFNVSAAISSSQQNAVLQMGDLPVTVLGYNIVYTLQTSKAECLRVRFKEGENGLAWSDDLLPVAAIATPGGIIPTLQRFRNGERSWLRTVAPKTALHCNYLNQSTTDVIDFSVVMRSFIWTLGQKK